MSEKKAKTYTAEFKESAVKLAVESDKPATETARELGVNVNTLHTWIAKYHRPKAASKPQKRASVPQNGRTSGVHNERCVGLRG